MHQGIRVMSTVRSSALGPNSHREAPERQHWSKVLRSVQGVRRILNPGEHLFHAGELCKDAFLVCSGSLKSYFVYEDGEEQIIGLHGPGDVLGFDAVFGQPASSSMVATDISNIEILPNPATVLRHKCSPEMTEAIMRGMRHEIMQFVQRLHMERHDCERRVAEFLIELSRRDGQRGLSTRHIMLPVNRRELARYLGLAPETLSRTFSAFQCHRILDVRNRQIEILDMQALLEAAGL